MLFERLLRAQLHRALLSATVLTFGCVGGGSGEPDPDEICSEVTTKTTASGDLSREPGFIKLPVGESCPTEPDLATVQAADCCPALSAEANCGLVDERVGIEQPYYGGYTTAEPEEATICEYDMVFLAGDACCGRPMFVEGTALMARVLPGSSDWTEPTALIAATDEARDIAIAYWREVARMEHASVASFGRVALELMRHGAPADLVRRAHEAALDEIGHAQLAFGIVQALGGEASRPGPLPLGGSVELSDDLADVAEAVVREGCIGETLAAMDAAARLRGARGSIADALATIVDDEALHAGLAWSTLKWLLAVGGEPVRARVAAVFAEGHSTQTALPVLPEGGAALGLMADEVRGQAMADAWAQVILPAWAAMGHEAEVVVHVG